MIKLPVACNPIPILAMGLLVILVSTSCTNSNDQSLNPTIGESITNQSEPQRFGSDPSKPSSYSDSIGLHVSGTGSATAEPDLAVISLGAEALSDTVEEARQTVANTIKSINLLLGKHGVRETDIQTSSFSIWPEYDYNRSGRLLLGYRVSHTLSVKVRNLETVGPIIDGLTKAGGNATRFNNIRFALEDMKRLKSLARTQAFEDAKTKAQQYANLAGFKLGRLAFIQEGINTSPSGPSFVRSALAMEDSTEISIGELEVSLSIQTIWAIDH